MGYVFDFKAARAYDHWFDDPRNSFEAELECRLMLEMLQPAKGESVLEIGCGTGASLVSLIEKGIIMADKVVINEEGDPVFYDCIIVGRDEEDEIKASYEFFVNVDDKNVQYIIILGTEELKG